MDEWITHLYKSKGGFAKNTRENRRSTAVEKRRDYRNSVLTQLRQIPQIMSPLHLDEKIEVPQEKPVKSKRMEMLEKWKKEKEKKQLEAKKKSKPIFKVCRVRSHENLNEVYSSIKGKKIIKDKAATSIQSDNEKKMPKPTSSLVATNIENSSRMDKKANAKSTSSAIGFNQYSANKGHPKSSLVPRKISQATSNGSEVSKKTKLQSIDNTGDLVKNKKLDNGLVTKKLIKISNDKSSTNKTINSEMNSQDKKKDCKVPKKKTPVSKNLTDTSGKIEKLNISTNNKSLKSSSHSQPSTSSFNNVSIPYMEQTYTERQMNHKNTPAKIGNLNISTNNETVKSPRNNHRSTSSCNNSSTPNMKETYTETQTVIGKSQSPCVPFEESMLSISANQTIETSRTICDNDYTLQVEHTNNSTKQIERKSLRISLQKKKIEKMLASEKTPIQKNISESLVENLSETEKKMKGGTPTGRYSECMTNCFVNLRPLNTNLYESTPLLNYSKKIRKNKKNQTETLDKEFNLSIENMESIPCNKSTKKTKSSDKKEKSTPHQQLDIPKDVSLISTSNEGKFLRNKSFPDPRNSSKLPQNKTSSSSKKRNSTRYSVSLTEIPSEGAVNEGETPDTSTFARLTRRRSQRVRYENTTNNSVKKSKTNKRKSVPVSQSIKKTYFTPNKSASDKESSNNVFETPKLTKDNEEDVINYISPFVTTSRGKTAARKEYHMRKSLEGFDSSIAGSTDPKSPKLAAAYFERLLNREIVRIQELCEVWQSYKESGNVSDDACGLIDMTIGQSNLLISKKFNQFRGLIERTRCNDQSEMKVQCEDLHGFWDMIFKQVEDLDKRFENLEYMKQNNWLEEDVRKKTPIKRGPKKKKRGRAKSATEASSLLKEAIIAARKKKAQSKSDGNLEIIIEKKNGTPDRKILANSSVLNFEKNSSTPARGILKSASAKSEKKKNVAFVETSTSGGHKENMLSPTFIRKDTPRPRRRSERESLGRSKLVFE
ncbi:hypothetical protein WA026_009075 [Henosepilachna vigintioctopunctata]|uniref:Disks large-associated protein 5 n=1 Tax=Henosepilachna vigintioctopunctata TaxID=420089 RepID=A0AAW1UZ53_9CUCU